MGQPGKATVISVTRGIGLCGILVFVLPWIFGSGAIWAVMPITELAVAAYALISMKVRK